MNRWNAPYNMAYFKILVYLSTQKYCIMDKWLYFGVCTFKKGQLWQLILQFSAIKSFLNIESSFFGRKEHWLEAYSS